MALASLRIENFRNLARVELELSPRLNLFIGSNGAGKTSVLEAAHFLGRARSFRTRHIPRLLGPAADSFRLFGTLLEPGRSVIPVGIERSRSNQTIRIDGSTVKRLVELVSRFPMQVINPDSHQLLEGGPQYRRRFLDWGVFHVEPTFYSLWQRYTQVLRQRNAALRQGAIEQQIRIWDSELVETATALTRMRRSYVESLLPILETYVSQLLEQGPIDLRYQPGWGGQEPLDQILEKGLRGDRDRGYTCFGPHRADLSLSLAGIRVQDRVSRGQQKQLIIALLLAQAQLFRDRTGRPCQFLLDDIAAELDPSHRQKVMQALTQLDAQVFLSAIEDDLITQELPVEPKRFHVEHGKVMEMV